jgi:hypothetical protein
MEPTGNTSAYLRIENGQQTIIAPDWPAVASLNARLAKALAAIQPTAKDGNNSFFGYRYVSYENAANAVRNALTAAGLGFALSIEDLITSTESNAKGTITFVTKVTAALTFLDPDKGALLTVKTQAEGSDTGDKSINKALTAALKYGLMRMFLCSTVDDDDPDAGTQQPDTAQAKRDNAAPPDRVATERQPTGKPVTEPHWINVSAKRNAFWATLNKRWTLTKDQVHAALGVTHIADFAGTPDAALETIAAWVAARAVAEDSGVSPIKTN